MSSETESTVADDDLKLRTDLSMPHVEKVYDEDLRGFCYEIAGSNVHVDLPMAKKVSPKPSLEIQTTYLLLLMKHVGRDFTFECGVKDTQSVVRRARFSTSSPRIRNSQFTHSIFLETLPGWQLYYIDFVDLMKTCFGQEFRCLQSLSIGSTVRVKAVLSTSQDPLSFSPAELLSSLMLNHWPGGGHPAFTLLVGEALVSRRKEVQLEAIQTQALHTQVPPWERDLSAAIDFCEPPPPKGLDTQSEDLWTPSLDVIEEDVAKNTADTEDVESVGSEGEIGSIRVEAGAKVNSRESAGCRTAL
ncbi:hypothetical protein GNI_068530 [Gregarina niphandrodes]|uniref:CFA20 domain-containing protein n=1 Tax=Gregarina niphandrodes TaxID=110365 RepID=A0A023B7K0_GRENI|nr:hypothetical protein GNI_068530 [Gregarina niphandrodes]EZG67514.1 hypothetical protein GNI_068530 [Gregarina niphandrodes]|eukprot:XP_011130229.1 hypothetical protein GNI_068530 [Gregarina niphandrodes]